MPDDARTFGSLFAGVGGFDVALERAGWRCRWQVERDREAQRVLAAHFPGVPVHADVTTVDPADLAPVDLVCGGWPCQDLSVAGRRAGLAGARSGLWHEVVRCLAGLRPRWFVGENVPGLLSSQGGEDFATVLSDLGRLGYGYAYRVLDAQHFGLAQRRKRVFLVGCLGDGPRAAAVLLEPEGVRRDSPAGAAARADVASALTRGLGSGGADDNKAQSRHLVPVDRMTFVPEVAPTLAPGAHPGGITGREAEVDGALVVTRALSTRQTRDEADTQTFVVTPIHAAGHHGAHGAGISQPGSPSYTLDCTGSAAVAFHLKQDPISGTKTPALGGSTGGMGVFTRATTTHAALDQGDPDRCEAATVASPRRVHSPVQSEVVTTGAAVRRLTPRECARLQGFPDDWLDGLGLADSTKYRMCGNAVAVPVVEWIIRRIAAVRTTAEVLGEGEQDAHLLAVDGGTQ